MEFFINRPVFAGALAMIMVVAGLVAALVLPISQYPELVPPQVKISTTYTGASAPVVANSVTTPIEKQLNGATDMIYMSSNSTNNGNSSIVLTFEVGSDQNFAQLEALTRTSIAEAQLPEAVSHFGLTVAKQSTNLLFAINLVSPNGTYDSDFLANYVDIHIKDPISRLQGVSSVNVFGLRQYAMRIWLDPAKLGNLDLTAADVVNAVKAQNESVAAGQLGKAPAPEGQPFIYQLNTLGRLTQAQQFEDIVIKALPDGSVVRIGDVGRAELGSDKYNWASQLDGKATGTLVVFQLPSANGLDLFKAAEAQMARLAKYFPEDVEYEILYNTTDFIRESIREIFVTLAIAIVLVIIVVYMFLQSFRATLIPAITVPVSLIGTCAAMAALGFSFNMLSLLGLVLAVGLVVDDAIVVVENVERQFENGETDPRKATAVAIAEVRGPVIATTLSLIAVFVPVAFLPGLTGQLYNQFALTIAISVGLSGINALTLSPALAAVLLRPAKGEKFIFFRWFNKAFAALAEGYANLTRLLARLWVLSLATFALLCAATVYLFLQIPTGFVPEEDQGYFIANIVLPEGASSQRTAAAVTKAGEILRMSEAISGTLEISGYNIILSLNQNNAGVIFAVLKPWDERPAEGGSVFEVMREVQEQFNDVTDARVVAVNAPAIPGLAATGGFQFEIQDRTFLGVAALSEATQNFIEQARQRPELAGIFTFFNTDTPQRWLEIDRVKAMTRGVAINDINDALQINLGSLYVNEFNRFGNVYKVFVQAEQDARTREGDISKIKVRNSVGEMIDLSTFVTIRNMTGPFNIPHYNGYPSAEIDGGPAPGYSSGQAITAMEELAEEYLVPNGFGYEWTGTTFQQLLTGALAPIAFGLSLIFVFLVLSAQYESWTMPFMVLLSVPLGLLGGVGALIMRGFALDVYGQIGMLMLIGLTAKNAILIVEFAKDERDRGKPVIDAAVEAARVRLRPILMTAFAFILGTLPLAIASGAGAAARQSLGTVVVAGLTAATLLIVFVPVFYYAIERVRERGQTSPGEAAPAQAEAGPAE